MHKLKIYISALFILSIIAITSFNKAIILANELPVDNQLTLFLKLLSFERNIITNNKKTINIGILYQSDNKLSNSAIKQISPILQKASIGSKRINTTLIDLKKSTTSIYKILKQQASNCNVFIITQINFIDFKEITDFSTQNSVLTFATSSQYMERYNFAMSIGYKGNTPKPYLNTTVLKQEGFSFPTQILNICKIIK